MERPVDGAGYRESSRTTIHGLGCGWKEDGYDFCKRALCNVRGIRCMDLRRPLDERPGLLLVMPSNLQTVVGLLGVLHSALPRQDAQGADITWIASAGGDWNVSADGLPPWVPSPSDHAQIPHCRTPLAFQTRTEPRLVRSIRAGASIGLR